MASVITSLYSVVTVILGCLIWKEHIIWVQQVGVLFTLPGIALVSIQLCNHKVEDFFITARTQPAQYVLILMPPGIILQQLDRLILLQQVHAFGELHQ